MDQTSIEEIKNPPEIQNKILNEMEEEEEKEEEEEEGSNLSDWEKNLLINLMEEFIEKITRVFQRNNLRYTTVCNLSFVPTDVKYLDLIKSRLLYTSEERALRDMESKAIFQKLKNDSTFLVNVLENVVEEMRSKGRFSTLKVIPREIENSRAKESSVLLKAKENLEGLKRLREIISHERQMNELEEKEFEKKLSIATREFETRYSKGKTSIAYVFPWEKARCEQNILRCKIDEEKLEESIERLVKEEENEIRVTADIKAFLRNDINVNEEEIKKWKNRYDRESIQYSGEIDALRERINVEKNELEKLKEERRVKQNFIDSYLAEKEMERRKKEHEDNVRRSTIKIQAWWRGVMVRRKLGRYRAEEKKKKRTPKSKK